MIKFLVLIMEAIFFLTVGLLYYYSPESSYFWNDGLGSSVLGIYGYITDVFVLSTILLILFNIIIASFGLIKKINKRLLMNIVYIEFMGIIAVIPSTFYYASYNGNIPLVWFISLLSATFSLILLKILKQTINLKTRTSYLYLALFIIASFISVLFLIVATIAAGF